jgi:nitrogen regulatory protein P-II 2
MKRVLVTIVTESVLERQLTEDVKRLGAHGYTVTEVRGEGARGVRAAEWEYSANIRLETICEERVAREIMEFVSQTYYPNYAMIAFIQEVEVMRGKKF